MPTWRLKNSTDKVKWLQMEILGDMVEIPAGAEIQVDFDEQEKGVKVELRNDRIVLYAWVKTIHDSGMAQIWPRH